ncbi:MAG: phenylalanine--tRNA ligase subunit beta [Actinobacteria bacterium]|nr:phenylalanine--tRNA ligase subunit beta [Actinomycetota bacterium]
MLVSCKWLKEYIDFNLTPEELAEQFALTGTAVEKVEFSGKDIEKIIVGEINDIQPHPNADNLVVCEVNTGEEVLEIVCGAKNMKTGDKVPVAIVGAVLPGGIKIKKSKIRGVESFGMMCSSNELRLGTDATGLLILDKDLKLGEDIKNILGLDNAVIELEITPNRPDCMSMIGAAREAGAFTGLPIKIPSNQINEINEPIENKAKVDILDSDLCGRYAARVVTNVKIGPSPLWMQNHLKSAGIRAINNVVDITNYVLMETGQPLHAFDYEKLFPSIPPSIPPLPRGDTEGLKGGKGGLIVRRAFKDEKMVTLDGVERILDEDILVIADEEKAVALGGVMGGATSEVSDKTTTVLIESANFNPANIMKTSRKLGLISESSIRFERGIDPNGVIYALDRAAYLMQELASGKVLKGKIDVYPVKKNPIILNLRLSRINNILGTDLNEKSVKEILEGLGLTILDTQVEDNDVTIKVSVPTFRPDLEREIDLIEEVARIYGYNNIESSLPEGREKQGGLSKEQELDKKIRNILVSSGLNEVITYSFIDRNHFDKLGLAEDDSLRNTIKIKNPMSDEQAVMRTTLIPSLIEIARYNTARDLYNVQIFEVGRVFLPRKNEILPNEPAMIGGLITGCWFDANWYEKSREIDFFDLKGIVEFLFLNLGINKWELKRITHPIFHPGRSAEILINDKKAGIIGELHPEAQAVYEFPKKVYVFEISEADLILAANLNWQLTEISRHPGVSRDIAFVIDEEVSASDIEKEILNKGGNLLKKVRLFDIYRGGQIAEGKKSMAYSLFFQANDRTLVDSEVSEIEDKIVSRLKEKYEIEMRIS